MNVKAIIDFIEHLPRIHQKNDLTYIRRILRELNEPQDKVKTFHITGTNGKGSTAYYLSRLLQKTGQSIGLFVSPYVEMFNERIQINGQPISDELLISAYQAVKNAIRNIQKKYPEFNLVTFEFETAMAFWIFAKQNCDYAVIEVGIGGEHDKTNVIVPQASIITTIGLDHEKVIGPTMFDIAHEKSGVIKKNRPVVLGNVPAKVLPLLMEKARKKNAPVLLLGRDFQVECNDDIVVTINKRLFHFKLRPQAEAYDIALALITFATLKFDISVSDIEETINNTIIPARYQIVQKKPLIMVDGAHNIQAVHELISYVRKISQGRIYILLGMMKDKDIAKVVKLFDPKEKITFTRISYPRAATKSDIEEDLNCHINFIDDYRLAYDILKNKLTQDDILVVTGSFYLAGAILNYIHGDCHEDEFK